MTSMPTTISIPEPAPPTFNEKITMIRQMVANLDTLTLAGQRHDMKKILDFLEEHVLRAMRGASLGNRRMLAEQLEVLKRAHDQRSPAVPAFSDRVLSLIAMIAPGA
jgi:hypothetical protein